jgi:hypothetical protein
MAVDYLKTYLNIDPNDYSAAMEARIRGEEPQADSSPSVDETTHDDAATKKFGRHRSHANDAKADNQPHKWMISRLNGSNCSFKITNRMHASSDRASSRWSRSTSYGG